MKVLFLSATHRYGTSSKTGNKYDMSRLTYLKPVEPVVKEGMTYLGYGMESREINLDPTVLNQFQHCTAGSEVDLILEPSPNNPSMNWVIGLVPPKQ